MSITPRARNLAFLSISAIALVLCANATARAQEYGFDVWTTAQGLPQNTVTGVVQTPDGYLWLSTFDGLARFDGVRFTIFDTGNSAGIVNNRFARLFVDRQGTLFATTENQVMTVYRNGRFRSYSDFSGPGNTITTIVADGRGNAVVETPQGYYALQGDRFVLTADRHTPGVVQNYWARSGARWVLERHQVTRTRDGRHTAYTLRLTAEELADGAALAPYEDQFGGLWLRRRRLGSELWRLHDGKVSVYTTHDIPALRDLYPGQIKEDADGSIWFFFSTISLTTPSEFIRFKDDRFSSHALSEPVGASASITDREGNFWLATTTGLRRLRRTLIRTLSVKDGLNHDEVYPLIQTANGDIVIGTVRGVNRWVNGIVTNPHVTDATKLSLYMRGLWEDDRARLWLGYQGEGGFGRLERPSFVRRLGTRELPNGATDFASDRDGNVWIATEEGLFEFKDDRELAHYTVADGLHNDKIITLHFDRGGRLWLGTFDGLAQFHNGTFTSFKAAPHSPQGFVRAIHEDADGVLWFGTYGDGLVRYEHGQFFNYRVTDGLFNNGVFAILEDASGNLWMSSNRGIHRVNKRNLRDYSDGNVSKLTSVSFDEKDGMRNAECNGGRLPAAIKTRDGTLWFSTMGGVAIVDPEIETANPSPPPVAIERISIDRRAVPLTEGSPWIELQPGQSNLAIEYTGLSFIKSEQMQFRYRLEGLEHQWIEAGTKRTVDYSYLPAGRYTFRVAAANASGVWNDEGTAVRIIVHPHFYQTWWFSSLVVVVAGGLVVRAYNNRVSRLTQIADAKTHFARQLIESQEAERKRIASELHDGLGQNLVVIKNRAVLGLNQGDDKDRVARELGHISESASHALDELREITSNLRPPLLDRLGLTRAITAMLKTVSGMIEVHSQIDSIDGLFPNTAEISLFRIVQESVNNVVKHSHASEASVRVTRGAHDVCMEIVDNGRGFDSKHPDARASGLGLAGLRERAQLLNAGMSIESNPGHGTRISVRIPLPPKA